jgi:hypothetical protein
VFALVFALRAARVMDAHLISGVEQALHFFNCIVDWLLCRHLKGSLQAPASTLEGIK